MLRVVVEHFLDSLNEREFDGPLLALLSSKGFYDIHYLHGPFEFGKDVIAKKHDNVTDEPRQYSIQSKAGNITQGAWRSVRPQLEECEYNTRAHPSFDESLPRVAVLVTTGRLVGAAPVDAQEFKGQCRARGLADFEVWDHDTILDWLCEDPWLGLTGSSTQDRLISLVSDIRRGTVAEPNLERYTREWLSDGTDPRQLSWAAIETSISCNLLRETHRLDLAALMALHLHRAAWRSLVEDDEPHSRVSASAIRLFAAYATELLEQVEPLLSDPILLAGELAYDPTAIAIYPAGCTRLVEILGLLALVADGALEDRAIQAISRLFSEHPGCRRPPADEFAVAIIPPVVALAKANPEVVSNFMRSVSEWLLDRHDPNYNGLGLGSLDDGEEIAVERLLAGALDTTQLQRRTSSYLATVVMDLLIALGADQLYEGVRENIEALRIVPILTAANEHKAKWRRGGDNVWPQPRVEYRGWAEDKPNHHSQPSPASAIDALLLSAVCRSRHYTKAIDTLLHS